MLKGFREDLRPKGDITTNLISLKSQKIKVKIWPGKVVLLRLDFCKTAKLIGKETGFKPKIRDGKKIKKNKGRNKS